MWKYAKILLIVWTKSCDRKYLRYQNLMKLFIGTKNKIRDIYREYKYMREQNLLKFFKGTKNKIWNNYKDKKYI
jgi:hypothetical protein